MSINLRNIAILNMKGSDYCCIISLISKNAAIKLLQNANLTEKKEYYKEIKKVLKGYMKMEKVIKFGDTEIQKQKFHQYKELISIKNIDIKKIVVSNKVSFGKKGFKYFIGYKNTKK